MQKKFEIRPIFGYFEFFLIWHFSFIQWKIRLKITNNFRRHYKETVGWVSCGGKKCHCRESRRSRHSIVGRFILMSGFSGNRRSSIFSRVTLDQAIHQFSKGRFVHVKAQDSLLSSHRLNGERISYYSLRCVQIFPSLLLLLFHIRVLTFSAAFSSRTNGHFLNLYEKLIQSSNVN